MSAPLRVGVIGLGARCVIAENCHKATIPAELVGGCDPNPAMRQRATEVLGDYPWFETLDELLELGIDCAIVTSPDDTHEDITCALLEAGVAVYLEKPIAITIEGSDRVLETAYRTKTPLYVGHNMRHMAVVRILRQVVQDGLIGEVRAIWCRHFVGNGGDYYFKDWHADRSRTTGLLLQKAAHDIDVMNWLSDSVPERVVGMGDLMLYGKLSDRSGQKSDAVMSDWFSFDNWPPASLTGLNPVIDVEDVSMLMMRQASGTLISYEQCHFTPDYWRNYTVIGSTAVDGSPLAISRSPLRVMLADTMMPMSQRWTSSCALLPRVIGPIRRRWGLARPLLRECWPPSHCVRVLFPLMSRVSVLN